MTEEEKNKTKKKPGEYTLEDYLALPDERRVELIDGVFYDMSAPTGYLTNPNTRRHGSSGPRTLWRRFCHNPPARRMFL